MNEKYTELLEAELSRFDRMLDGEALVRWAASLYDKDSGGFYYSGSARDNEQFKPDIESTSQMITLLSSLGLFKYNEGENRFPSWFKNGLINYFRSRQDEETGFFFDVQYGKEVNESKKGRNLGQSTARLRELGSSPLYPTPTERVSADLKKKNEILPEHYSSPEKFKAWLDAFEWDSDDGHKQYFAANMLAASSESIKAAGFLNFTRDYITSIQNKETGLWGKMCDSMAMNAAMKISFLYDSEYKYPNVDKMISSIGKIVESEEPYSVSTLWNPLVLVRNVIRWYGDIPKELEEKINECKLPLIKTCIDRIERFKKPDGGFSYYPNQSCPTSQGVVVSLGLADESDVNGTMLSTASMRDTMRIIVGGSNKPILSDYNSLFFDLIGKENKMAINIGTRREPLWDYTIVDKEKTTASLSVNRPQKCEIVYDFDGACEGDAYYPTVTRVKDKWRIYFGSGQGAKFLDNGKLDESDIHVCVIESEDGIHWTRPVVGKYGENNMILKHPTEPRDNLSVFVDTNPTCQKDRRYKGLVRVEDGCKVFAQGGALACYASADGLNFERIEDVSREPGKFDSLNTAYYDEQDGVYKLYHRDFLDGKRAIRYKTSKNFLDWKDEGIITFDDDEKFQLYTNNIKQYYRAPHVQIGFPVRYTERTEWTDNYEQMPDLEHRKSLLDNKDYKRCGLALTDSLFMTSRDGLHWHRFHEAFLAPSEEKNYEWKYGHCYLSHGFVETDKELYFYAVERRRHVGKPMEAPSQLRKYSVRLDGFASFKAPYAGGKIVTKPLIFSGTRLSINFKTSAAGSIYVKIIDTDGNTAQSIEIFGNNIDRKVAFDKHLSDFANKEVTIEFYMRDAEIYSFKFE